MTYMKPELLAFKQSLIKMADAALNCYGSDPLQLQSRSRNFYMPTVHRRQNTLRLRRTLKICTNPRKASTALGFMSRPNLSRNSRTCFRLCSISASCALRSVLLRKKFDRRNHANERARFLDLMQRIATLVEVTEPVRACRDPKDDMILSTAVAGGERLILTGDDDLLALHPFRRIANLSPRQFLDRLHMS